MIDDFSKVENFPNLIRDSKTNAILNTDSTEYNNYIRTKQKISSQKHQIKKMEEDLSELKSSMDDIKQLLRKLTNGS
jgi:hypothetical protein